MKFKYSLLLCALLAVAGFERSWAAETTRNFGIWEKEISAYERMDATNPPPKGGYEFIGSSVIARWKTLRQDFPGEPVFDRGFGGSWVMDSTHFAERIVIPYAPRKIFFRAGGNDLAAGKTAAAVYADFQEFVSLVHAKLPETVIYFISWNPTPARWKQREKEKELNRLVAKFAEGKVFLKYIEVNDLPMDGDGKPRADLFVGDHLHFNAAGYQFLAAKIRPYVTEELPAPAVK